MKKILYSIIALTMAVFTFTSCEDVPAPYEVPGSGDDSTPSVATGDGSLENPYNCVAANELAATLSSGEVTEDYVYIKGRVYSISDNFDGGYGNATFYISDDGTSDNRFYCYRIYYFNNAKYSSGEILAEGDSVIVYAKITNYNGTYETSQGSAYLYYLNGTTGDGGGGSTGEATGSGTLEDPYNSVAAAQYAESLGANVNSDNDVYIKGKVVSIKENFNTTYGNATFYISDDGTSTDQFYIYRALYLGNAKYTSGTQLKEGDDVIICGKVVLYSSSYGETPETVQNQAYVYSINGVTESSGGGSSAEEGEGTATSPYSVAQALSIINAGSYTSDNVYVSGIISQIDEVSTSYGNATYYISDDGTTTSQLEVYRGYYLDGEKFTSEDQIKVGDKVVVCGVLTMFYSTPEFTTGSSIYSIESGTSGGGGTSGGEVSGNSITVTSSDLGLSNGQEAGTIELSDGTTLTFGAGTNNNSPKYYDNGTNIRMYPTNTMTISSSKTISSVVINCDTYNSIICNASGDVSANPGTVAVNDAVITVSGINSTSTTITNSSGTTGTASQIRMTSLVITYAE